VDAMKMATESAIERKRGCHEDGINVIMEFLELDLSLRWQINFVMEFMEMHFSSFKLLFLL
jgi:hypothetical protein